MITPQEAKAAEEAAKAVQQIGRTADNYKDLIKQFGEFVGSIVGPPLVQASGLLTDTIATRRVELGLRRKRKFEQLLVEQNVTNIRSIPLSTAYPLLEAATIEEDDEIGDMFSQLIVSFVDADNADYVPKLFIETLRQLTPIEAAVLKAMYDAPAELLSESGMMLTANLPRGYAPIPTTPESEFECAAPNLVIVLSSLQQLGCIEGAATWGGYRSLDQAMLTPYGRSFLKAVYRG